MGPLTDTKVRGFMVTETNNEACAQLQLMLHALLACAHTQTSDPASVSVGPLVLSWSISIDSHEANSGR